MGLARRGGVEVGGDSMEQFTSAPSMWLAVMGGVATGRQLKFEATV